MMDGPDNKSSTMTFVRNLDIETICLAALGGFCGVTIGWIVWCLSADGDFLDLSPALVAVIGIPAVIGGACGSKASSRGPRAALLSVAVFCLLFWLAVPDGWWASPPPRPAEISNPG